MRTVFLLRKPLPSAKTSPFFRYWIHNQATVCFRRGVQRNRFIVRSRELGRCGEVDDGEPKTSAHKAWQAACPPRRLRAGAPAVRIGCRSVGSHPRRASNCNVFDAWQTAGYRVLRKGCLGCLSAKVFVAKIQGIEILVSDCHSEPKEVDLTPFPKPWKAENSPMHRYRSRTRASLRIRTSRRCRSSTTP